MTVYRLDQLDQHKALVQCAQDMQRPQAHLKHLIAAPDRLQNYSVRGGGLFLDFSRQRLDDRTRDLLFSLEELLGLRERFGMMAGGAKLNVTEKRAVLHTAARSFDHAPVLVDGKDVLPEIRRVRDQIKRFSDQVHSGRIAGAGGKPFRHVVVIGIGGSYLGPEFVSTALAPLADRNITLHYLANVDIDNFGAVAKAIDPPTTLWVVISKSFTTAETSANTAQAEQFMRGHGLDPAKHMVSVTAKGSPGDDPARPVLQTFHMFDFIGGRYSVTSAVGGVPLSLYLGYERFEAFLKGAAEMDRHALDAPVERNLPLIAALISVWNTTCLGYQQQAVIPYSSPLAKLAPHVQQLNMESNGKAVDIEGQLLPKPAGVVIFGEPGTNAQHSFFQLAHQGRPFPIDFIGVLRPHFTQYDARSKGVTNHQELWANMLAQARALAIGAGHDDQARFFSGNRPSSTLLLDDLSAENIGRLLSFYEARTVYEGFIWGINSFDQFGVELGKKVADTLRGEMVQKNDRSEYGFEAADPISKFYLEKLFEKK
ncbi:MAG: glucose-6-phosphate isomerase [Desulfobacteraceae bacterium]|nr:MAG: glucose-6-phosphate isomerase [Desulfobacteraceae bacterium]